MPFPHLYSLCCSVLWSLDIDISGDQMATVGLWLSLEKWKREKILQFWQRVMKILWLIWLFDLRDWTTQHLHLLVMPSESDWMERIICWNACMSVTPWKKLLVIPDSGGYRQPEGWPQLSTPPGSELLSGKQLYCNIASLPLERCDLPLRSFVGLEIVTIFVHCPLESMWPFSCL